MVTQINFSLLTVTVKIIITIKEQKMLKLIILINSMYFQFRPFFYIKFYQVKISNIKRCTFLVDYLTTNDVMLLTTFRL